MGKKHLLAFVCFRHIHACISEVIFFRWQMEKATISKKVNTFWLTFWDGAAFSLTNMKLLYKNCNLKIHTELLAEMLSTDSHQNGSEPCNESFSFPNHGLAHHVTDSCFKRYRAFTTETSSQRKQRYSKSIQLSPDLLTCRMSPQLQGGGLSPPFL